MRARTLGALTAMSLVLAACSSGSTEPGDTTVVVTLAPQPDTTLGGSTTSDGSDTTSTTAAPEPTEATSAGQSRQTVSLGPLPTSARWGDPAIPVGATASSGLSVDVGADGACTAEAGELRLDAVGTCTVTATQPGDGEWSTASATATIEVLPADPVVTFEARRLTFVRNLRVELWAESNPTIPLVYEIVDHPDTSHAEACSIDGTALVFDTEPEPTPAPAACAIRVSAEPSPNYTTPDAVVTLIEIGFANWSVRIEPVGDTVGYASSGGLLEITVFEDSGSAYGMRLEGPCGSVYLEGSADPGYPAPVGTFEYTYSLTLEDPAAFGGSYTCDLTASAQPLDHYGGEGSDTLSFTVGP